MKKLMLVSPLIMIGFLFGCGSNENDYLVNESELYDAINLKGVNYLQVDSKTVLADESINNTSHTETSPNVFHGIRSNTAGEYYENFVSFDEGKPTGMWYRESKDATFEHTNDVYESDYVTIEKFKKGPLKNLIGKNYDEFTYNSSTKEYSYSFYDSDYSAECDGVITFYKKRIKSFAVWLKDKSRDKANTFKLDYEEKTPTPPTDYAR